MTVNGYTYKVGDLFTTLKSKKTGVIKEIIPNASGSVRVLIEMPTKETRWTTVSNASLTNQLDNETGAVQRESSPNVVSKNPHTLFVRPI